MPQLLGRLRVSLAKNDPDSVAPIEALLWAVRGLLVPPAFVPRWPSFLQAGGPEIRRFEGHTKYVHDVAFSPDGRRIVSASGYEPLRLWDVATGESSELVDPLDESRCSAVAFSPDGQRIVSGSWDNTLRLWEAASGQSRRFEGHTGEVTALAFSPDGRHIVSGSRDGTLRLWEAASGQSRRFQGHTSSVFAVAFFPDGRHIVSGSYDNTLRLWEAASGRELARLEGDSSFMGCAIAPNGKSLAAGDDGGRVHLLDILVEESDKTIWLGGLASGGGPTKPAAPPSVASGRAISTSKLNADETRHSALRRFFAALTGKSKS
jgi:WD40 repeat protein